MVDACYGRKSKAGQKIFFFCKGKWLCHLQSMFLRDWRFLLGLLITLISLLLKTPRSNPLANCRLTSIATVFCLSSESLIYMCLEIHRPETIGSFVRNERVVLPVTSSEWPSISLGALSNVFVLFQHVPDRVVHSIQSAGIGARSFKVGLFDIWICMAGGCSISEYWFESPIVHHLVPIRITLGGGQMKLYQRNQ